MTACPKRRRAPIGEAIPKPENFGCEPVHTKAVNSSHVSCEPDHTVTPSAAHFTPSTGTLARRINLVWKY